MDYIDNFKKATHLWWEHKYLWILGIIVAIFSGGSNSFRMNFPSSESGGDFATEISEFMGKIGSYFETIPTSGWIVIVIVFAGITLTWFAVSLYIGFRAKSALLKSSSEIYDGKKLSLKQSWSLGKPYWVKLAIQHFVIFLPIYLFMFSVLLMILLAVISMGGFDKMNENTVMIFVLSICCMMIVMFLYLIFVGIITPFAQRKLVLEDMAVIQSVKAGLVYVKVNFVELFVSWLLIFCIFVFIGFVSLFVVGIIFGILSLIVVVFIYALFEISPIVATIVAFIIFLVVIGLAAVIQGPLTAFTEIYWTTVYKRVNEFKAKN